jgi:hypothetical protein
VNFLGDVSTRVGAPGITGVIGAPSVTGWGAGMRAGAVR